ncbi:MAG TPA: TRIC cation channel family protein [Reyranella sp.]|jgi:uncharacterized membrane protein YeiH|nr:TRIC cation channel family protein [Reyranella sp.]
MFPFSDAVFHWYDLGATFLWAISGAMLAARRGYDIMGVFIIAMVSSTGGGLIRDGLFLPGSAAPKLIQTPDYLMIVTVVTAMIWLFGRALRRLAWLPPALTLADALGIGAYGVVGMHLAVAAGIPMIGAILIGVVNAVGGGALRDLLMNQKLELLQPSVLMGLASLIGCLLFAVLLEFGAPGAWAGAAAAVTAFAVRLLAVRFNLRSRPLAAFEEDWRQP